MKIAQREANPYDPGEAASAAFHDPDTRAAVLKTAAKEARGLAKKTGVMHAAAYQNTPWDPHVQERPGGGDPRMDRVLYDKHGEVVSYERQPTASQARKAATAFRRLLRGSRP